VDPATGLARANARNEAEGKVISEGRFEAESLAFHTRIREGFLDWASKHSGRFIVLDGMQNQDAVFELAKAAVEQRLRPC